jgi:hypothetical protein
MWALAVVAAPVAMGFVLIFVGHVLPALRHSIADRRHRRDLDKALAAYRKGREAWQAAGHEGPPPVPPGLAMPDLTHTVTPDRTVNWHDY